MHGLNRRKNGTTVVALASAVTALGLVRATYGTTYTEPASAGGAAEPTSFFIASGGGFLDIGNGGAGFPGWGAVDFPSNLTPAIPNGQQVTAVAPDATVTMYYDLFANGNSHNPTNPVTLDFYLATDTSTTLNGGPLRYESPSDNVGGLNNPGNAGSFAAGSTLFPLGSGIYPGNSTADQSPITFSLANAFSAPAAQTFVQNTLNGGGTLRLVIASEATTDTGTEEFYGPTTTVTVNGTSLAPSLALDLTTGAIPQNASALYVTANGQKTGTVSLGQSILISGTPTLTALKGSTITGTVTLLNGGAIVGGDPTVNASLYKIGTNVNGHASATGTNPLNAQANTSATIGMNGSDTTVAAGSNVTATVTFVNQSNTGDGTVTVTSNAVHIVESRFVNTGDSGVGTGALGAPDVGKVLVGKTITTNVPIFTTNTDVGTDFSSNKLTTITLKGNSKAANFNVLNPFTSATVAIIGANTNSLGDQLFDNTQIGSVNAIVNAKISGVYGDARTETIGGTSKTFSAQFAQFSNSGSSTVIIGSGLVGESDSARSYIRWEGYQAAAVTGNTGTLIITGGSSATLSNAASNDDVITSNSVTMNDGLRANAWVTGVSFNQFVALNDWSQTGLTPSSDGSGTNLAPGGAGASAALSFTPTQALNGTYGATMTVKLENEQDVQGTAVNDVAPLSYSIQTTVSSNPSVESGNYILDGGTLSAPATNLTGSYSQTGGSSVFQGFSGSGTVSVSGGSLQLATSSGLSTVSKLSVTGSGSLDITNNRLIINYGAPGNDPVASIAALLTTGYNAGAWNGPGGIVSSTVATNPGYSVGYADSADTGNPAGLASGTMEIAYTLIGDADLNRTVNGIDFGILAANFNKTVVNGWDKGDFDYNGIVNGIDFTALAANFNKAASGASAGATAADFAALDAFAAANGLLADVPEPTSIGLLAAGAAGLMVRRRKRS
jgi:hypothetical protein